MRMYDVKEVVFLQLENSTIQVNDTSILVKRSPTEHRAGYIDPHEFEIVKNRASETKTKIEKEPTIDAIRESMGFPNRNLNTVEIHTKFETLNIGANEVGLWRHYPRKTQNNKDRPCLIFIHGGGWIGGSTYTVENPCRLIAELVDAVVFNVDYSLAPEKPFPHGFNDCYGVVEHVYANADKYGINRSRIAVGGDSAGGNLAAAVSMKDRDMGTNMVALQVLIYPCVTFLSTGVQGYAFDISEYEMADEQKDVIDKLISIGRPAHENDDSIQMGDKYIKTKEVAYLPYVSPMLAQAHANLPRTLCVSAEFDGLRIQDEHYAMLLEKAGVKVKAIRYKGVAHAFLDKLGFLPQAEDLCIEITQAMKEM